MFDKVLNTGVSWANVEHQSLAALLTIPLGLGPRFFYDKMLVQKSWWRFTWFFYKLFWKRKFSVRILVEIERKFAERKDLSMIKSTLIFRKKEQELSHCKNYTNFIFWYKQTNKQKTWMYLNALASHWPQNRRYFVEKLHHR